MEILQNTKIKVKVTSIVILRVIAIIGVVLYHSFSAVYNITNTNAILNFIFKDVFMLLSLNMAMIPLFTFISGYLFSYTQEKNYKNFKSVFVQKAKRLLLPFLLFGLFFEMLTPNNIHLSVTGFLKDIIRGADHLWFLLMLFNCFIVFVLIQKNKLYWLLLFFLYVIYFIIHISNFEYLNKLFSFERFILFFPWFCIGYFSYLYEKTLKILNCPTNIFLLIFLYLAIVIYSFVNNDVYGGFIDNYKSYINQLLAVFILFIITKTIKFGENSKYFVLLEKYDSLSFGIYIFHLWIIHLVIQNVYSKDVMRSFAIESPVYFSLILFLISFSVSILITKLFKCTKLGIYLLG